MRSETTSGTSRPPGSAAPLSDGDRLQRRVDELAQQVLQARDAAVGAEAELGMAMARIAELEREAHVRAVEIEELRSAVDRPRAGRDGTGLVATGERLARGAVRRVRHNRR